MAPVASQLDRNIETMRPFVRKPEQMQKYLEILNEDGFKTERLDELIDTVNQREDLLVNDVMSRLKKYDPSLDVTTGEAADLLEDMALFRQEAQTKKKWTTWEYVKSVPSRVWQTMKAHPYITTGIVLTLAGVAGAGLYYSGAGTTMIGWLKNWITSSFLGNGAAQAAEKATEIAGQATEAVGQVAGQAGEVAGQAGEVAKEALGGVMENIPSVVPSTPVPPMSMPTMAPSIEEADMLLDQLINK